MDFPTFFFSSDRSLPIVSTPSCPLFAAFWPRGGGGTQWSPPPPPPPPPPRCLFPPPVFTVSLQVGCSVARGRRAGPAGGSMRRRRRHATPWPAPPARCVQAVLSWKLFLLHWECPLVHFGVSETLDPFLSAPSPLGDVRETCNFISGTRGRREGTGQASRGQSGQKVWAAAQLRPSQGLEFSICSSVQSKKRQQLENTRGHMTKTMR